MNLRPDTILQRAAGIRILLRDSGAVEVERDGEVFVLGGGGLSVLDAFSAPRPFEPALHTLTARAGGRAEGVEIVETIFALLNTGLLRRVDGESAAEAVSGGELEEMRSHLALLGDRARTEAFLAAIAEVVRPGDVVLDIGTGSGVLAIAAARAGARQVYAIEARRIAGPTAAFFRASPFADRIRLLRGWSHGVELPERADVLVTETIGDDPLDERIVDVVADARARLLAGRARIIPATLDVFAQPFAIPEEELRVLTLRPEDVAAWGDDYGIDFEPLRLAVDRTLRRCFVNPYRARSWRALAEPARILSLDFSAPVDPPLRIAFDLPGPERPDGILVFFRTRLSPSVTLSTDPRHASAGNSWMSPLWLPPADGPLPRSLSFRNEARRRLRLEWPEVL